MSLEAVAGIKMRKKKQPPFYFMILLVFCLIFSFFNINLIPKPYNYLGVLLIIIGIVLNLWVDALFKKMKTEINYHKKPSKLVTFGPFRFSRNPIYLGMFLILLGVAILSKNLISIIFVLLFVIIIEKKFIPVEEENLKNVFGKEYIKYKERVRKWI